MERPRTPDGGSVVRCAKDISSSFGNTLSPHVTKQDFASSPCYEPSLLALTVLRPGVYGLRPSWSNNTVPDIFEEREEKVERVEVDLLNTPGKGEGLTLPCFQPALVFTMFYILQVLITFGASSFSF